MKGKRWNCKIEIHIRVELNAKGKAIERPDDNEFKRRGKRERGENVPKLNRTDANLLISKKQREASAHPWPCKVYSQSLRRWFGFSVLPNFCPSLGVSL